VSNFLFEHDLFRKRVCAPHQLQGRHFRHDDLAIVDAKAQSSASAPTKIRRCRMASGNVKWFNPTKGYGFIQPSEGGKDVFVHISAVERAGLSTLNEGQRVEYELVSNRGKTSAENLKVT